MLRICRNQCYLWFLFKPKIWLFISRCRRPSLINFPTFSHEIVVFRLEWLHEYPRVYKLFIAFILNWKFNCKVTYFIFDVGVVSCFLRSPLTCIYARTKSEPEVFGDSIFNRNLTVNRPQPRRQSAATSPPIDRNRTANRLQPHRWLAATSPFTLRSVCYIQGSNLKFFRARPSWPWHKAKFWGTKANISFQGRAPRPIFFY